MICQLDSPGRRLCIQRECDSGPPWMQQTTRSHWWHSWYSPPSHAPDSLDSSPCFHPVTQQQVWEHGVIFTCSCSLMDWRVQLFGEVLLVQVWYQSQESAQVCNLSAALHKWILVPHQMYDWKQRFEIHDNCQDTRFSQSELRFTVDYCIWTHRSTRACIDASRWGTDNTFEDWQMPTMTFEKDRDRVKEGRDGYVTHVIL